MNSRLRTYNWFSAGTTVLALLAVVISLYRETGAYLVSVWNQWELGDYGHGYLVLLISAYLVYLKRRELLAVQPCPSRAALLPLGLSVLAWLLAVIADVQIVQSAALFGLLTSVVWALLGTRVIRVILFPLSFLCLALPVWSVISPYLQEITADSVYFLTRLIDIPAMREENHIVLPAGSLAIEEACSGLRYVLAATTLGALFAYLNYTAWRVRLAILSIAVLGAIFMNIIRVLVVVMLAYKSDMMHPLVNDHLLLGWYLFAALVALLLLTEYLANRWGILVHDQDDSVHPDKNEGGQRVCRGSAARHGLIIVIASLLVVIAPLSVGRLKEAAPPGNEPATIVFPDAGKGWEGPYPSLDSWQPTYLGAVTGKREYRSAGGKLYYFVAYYPYQQQGRELVSDLNSISGFPDWKSVRSGESGSFAGVDGAAWELLESGAGEKRLVYYWYNVAGVDTTNTYMAKALQLYGAFSKNPGGGVYILGLDVKPGKLEQAHSKLQQFLSLHRASMKLPPIENNE